MEMLNRLKQLLNASKITKQLEADNAVLTDTITMLNSQTEKLRQSVDGLLNYSKSQEDEIRRNQDEQYKLDAQHRADTELIQLKTRELATCQESLQNQRTEVAKLNQQLIDIKEQHKRDIITIRAHDKQVWLERFQHNG